MAENNGATVVKLATILAESFGRKASEPMLDGYRLGLAGVPSEALMAALPQLLRSCKFMPTVADILEAAGVRSGALQLQDKATLAWEAVRRAIARVGAYESPKFVDDPYIVPTIRAMGGWVQLCDTPPDEMQWREKAFRTNYATLSQHPVSPEMAGQLGTLCDLGGIPNIALVRSLPAGTEVVHRIAEPPEGKRISASEAAEKLVKRLGVDDVTAEPQKWANVSKVEQLAALSALAGRKS